MLCRQKPNDLSNLMTIDKKTNSVLQQSGRFLPLYFYNGFFYYEATDELIEFLRKCGEMVG